MKHVATNLAALALAACAPSPEPVRGVPVLAGMPSDAHWVRCDGVTIERGDVAEGPDVYRDHFAAEGDDEATVARVDVDERTAVVAIAGEGPWYESSVLFVELCAACDPITVDAVALRWSGDVAPYAGWCEDLVGTVVIGDDTRIGFDLERARGTYAVSGTVALPATVDDDSALADVLDEYLELRAER